MPRGRAHDVPLSADIRDRFGSAGGAQPWRTHSATVMRRALDVLQLRFVEKHLKPLTQGVRLSRRLGIRRDRRRASILLDLSGPVDCDRRRLFVARHFLDDRQDATVGCEIEVLPIVSAGHAEERDGTADLD